MIKYLVSVFVDGKNVNSYFSFNLDDLITIKALHKNCDIQIFDLKAFVTFPQEQVEIEIKKSGQRWKQSIGNTQTEKEPPVINVVKRDKVNKYWERPVKCVETGQIFPSIKECSERIGISHKSLWNAINSKKPRGGLHFVNAVIQIEQKTENEQETPNC